MECLKTRVSQIVSHNPMVDDRTLGNNLSFRIRRDLGLSIHQESPSSESKVMKS